MLLLINIFLNFVGHSLLLLLKNSPSDEQTTIFSLKEAENLRKEFLYLVGKPFNKECSASIDCIAIAPFDEISKKGRSYHLAYLMMPKWR